MNTNFYEEKLEEVNLLIKNNQLLKVVDILKEELNMPYVPAKYEVQFKKILDETIFKLMDDKGSNTMVNIEDVLSMLNKDEESQAVALELLKGHNLRPVASVLKARIESWDQKDNLKRSFLFEMLAEQEINIDVSIDGSILNPSKNSILENIEVVKGLKMIPSLVEKTPQLLEPTIGEYRRYLLLNFPNKIQDGEQLARNIFNIINHMFNQENSLTNEEVKILEILNG